MSTPTANNLKRVAHNMPESMEWADTVVKMNGKPIKTAGITINQTDTSEEATITFPSEMTKTEVVTVDGHIFDHTFAGKTIPMPEGQAEKKFDISNLQDRLDIKTSFEKEFGEHRDTRTTEQWKKLVNVYGIRAVCRTEKLHKWEVLRNAGAPRREWRKVQRNEKGR